MADRLSTEETAARLGVKKETIYAYVSRGILNRERAVDGRASTFDAAEVDRLSRQRTGDKPGRLATPVSTSITEVSDGSVAYRDVSVGQLVEDGQRYESAAALLWDVADLDWHASPEIRQAVASASVGLHRNAGLVDHLALTTIVAASHDPFRNDRSPAGAAAAVRQLISTAVETLPLHTPVSVDEHATIADRLWPRLTAAGQVNTPVLDRALVLLADHGMASSTMAARIAASTRGGPHAWITAGLGALNGPLHGSAGLAIHTLLDDAQSKGHDEAIARVLEQTGQVPGMGHLIHRHADPRFDLLIESVRNATFPQDRLDIVEEMIARTRDRVDQPFNIDFAIGSFTFAAGMRPDAGELIFAIARIAGWVAHGLEEQNYAPLRFRPVGRYDKRPPRPAPPSI